MERNGWIVLGCGAAVAVLGVSGLGFGPVLPGWSEELTNPWNVASIIVLGAGGLIMVVACGLFFVPHKAKYAVAVNDRNGGKKELSLARSDGEVIGYADVHVFRRRLFRPKRLVGVVENLKNGRTISYSYPDDFKEVPSKPVEVGTYGFVFYESIRKDQMFKKFKGREVAKGRFRFSSKDREDAERLARRGTFVASNDVTDSGLVRLKLYRHELPIGPVRAAVTKLHADGTTGPEFLGSIEEVQKTETELIYPNEFERTVSEERIPRESGGYDIRKEIEQAKLEPGRYTVIWAEIRIMMTQWVAEDEDFPSPFRFPEVASDQFEVAP